MSSDTSLFFILNGFAGRTPLYDAVIFFTAEYLPVIVVALFPLYLVLARNYPRFEKRMAISSAFAAALIARYALGSPIRYFFPRPRPFLTYDVHQLIAEHSQSFPSGHALFLSAFSTVVFMHNKKLGLLLFDLTTLVSIARIMGGVHYPSDILAGTLIGIVCGLATHAGTAYISRRRLGATEIS